MSEGSQHGNSHIPKISSHDCCNLDFNGTRVLEQKDSTITLNMNGHN